jgi:flagellum-specific ATP synthase
VSGVSLVSSDAVALALRRTTLHVDGRVERISGLLVEATLPQVRIGAACAIDSDDGPVDAEVVGFSGQRALLMPVGDTLGLRESARVRVVGDRVSLRVGDALLGRIVDPMLAPLDGGPPIHGVYDVPLQRNAPSPMTRRRIAQALPTGIRAIDTVLTIGEGQRVGIMAGAGVGKSVLLGMLARSTAADVIVAGFVGERGREVREFVERDLGAEALRRSVLVVATGDQAPLLRVRAATAATAIAEHFRAQGKKVLLLLDSLTRVAMAQREIGLSAGEPPTTKGYPPSVFVQLPKLLERAGNDDGQGSITGVYTVLVEGDDLSDPVADSARSILDGHIVLSRRLAGGGHFPAIDVLQSASRVMSDVVDERHLDVARAIRAELAIYQDSADLVEVGAYVRGTNPKLDVAMAHRPELLAFLRQAPAERVAMVDALAQGRRITSAPTPTQTQTTTAMTTATGARTTPAERRT